MTRSRKVHLIYNPKVIFSVIVALIPVLAPYASFFDGIYLEEFLLIITTLLAFFYKRTSHSEFKTLPVFILAVEILISVLLNLMFQYGQTIDVLVRSIRMLFYLFVITFTSSRLLDLNITMKSIVIIAVYSVFFLILQTILYRTTGIYLKGMGNFLPLAYRDDFDWQYYMDMMFRPSSIFSEPAAMCEYLLVPLSYVLLRKQDKQKYEIALALFISLGCLLTTSLWGIVIVVVIWSIWLFKVAELKKHFLVLIVVIPAALYFVLNSTSFSTAMSRIDVTDMESLINSRSFSGRFMGYDALESLDIFEKLFGLGFGNLGVRSQLGTGNAVLYYLLGLGFVGTIIFFIACIFSFLKIRVLWQKTIFGMMLILSFGAGTLNTRWIMYYFIVSVYLINNIVYNGEQIQV